MDQLLEGMSFMLESTSIITLPLVLLLELENLLVESSHLQIRISIVMGFSHGSFAQFGFLEIIVGLHAFSKLTRTLVERSVARANR